MNTKVTNIKNKNGQSFKTKKFYQNLKAFFIPRFKKETILYLVESFSMPIKRKSCLTCKNIVLNSIKRAETTQPVNKFKKRGTQIRKILFKNRIILKTKIDLTRVYQNKFFLL